MSKPEALRTDRYVVSPASIILGVGSVIALGLGFQLGGGANAALMALGLIVLAAAVGAGQFPLLGLIGVTVVTVGNLADVLIQFWGAPSITFFLIPGLAFILAYRWILRGERPFLHGGALAAISVFLLMVLFSSLYAFEYGYAIAVLDDAIRNMIIVALFLCFFHLKNSVSAVSDSIVYFALFCSAIAIYKYGIVGDIDNQYGGFARTSHGGPRLSGTRADPNGYGAVLVLMLPLAIDHVIWSKKNWRRLIGAAAVVGIVASIMLTQSRGTLLATMFAGALYGLTLDRKSATRFFGAAAIIGLVALSLLSQELVERFSSITAVTELGMGTDKSVAYRLSAWAVALQLFQDNPLFGVGAGNFNALYETTATDLGIIWANRDLSPHGLFLEVLSEYGAVGLAIFLGILASAGVGILRAMATLKAHGELRARAMCAAFGVGLASYLAAMVFLHGPGARFLWLFIVLSIAMPAIVRHRLRDRSSGPGEARGQLQL